MARSLAVCVVLLLSACQATVDEPIRTSLERPEFIQDIDFETRDGVLNGSPYERVHFPSDSPGSNEFLLFSFEIDDHGSLFLPAQTDTVHDLILKEAADRGALIVAFVHGWKHNATPCDDNLACFRKVLKALVKREDQRGHRKVIGVYIGWRGLSRCEEPAKEISFWERKRTAQRVGESKAREVLQMLREVQENLNDPNLNLPEIAATTLRTRVRSRLVVVGHSFGAALVYSAVENDLEQQLSAAVRLAKLQGSAKLKEIDGFGDLVVLVNPAFEAELFQDIYKQVRSLERTGKSFAKDQRPALVVVSSVGDVATHWAFPFGQVLNLLAQPLRILRGPVAWYNHIVTIGNHLRFRTYAAEPIVRLSFSKADVDKSEHQICYGPAPLPSPHPACGCSRMAFDAKTLKDLPVGNDIYGNVRLTRIGRLKVANDPFWVIKADRSVVADHGDIFNPTFVTFLAELVARYAPPDIMTGEKAAGGSK